MNHKLAALALAILLAAAMATPCAAQTPTKQPPTKPAPAAPPATAGGVTITPSGSGSAAKTISNVEEGQKVAEIQAVLATGEFDKAIEAANTFLKTARDEVAKTEAIRVLAEAYRKKGDWRLAAATYPRLRERYDKNSDDYFKYDGIADILKNSPAGVYQAAGAAAGKAPAGTGQTLADDAVLAEALTKLAATRGLRLKTRIGTITRGTTPQMVVAAYLPVAEESKQILSLSPDAPPEAPREVCTAVGNKLQTLGNSIIAALKLKLDKLQPKMAMFGAITNLDKTDITNSKAACREMAEAETKYQQALMLVAGKGDWPDQARLTKESAERRASYEQLGNQFIVPASYGLYGW
ncbi:MAG: hypothetical protein NT049_05005 [Planctomycetota bacterium]|nr:hypothetical protein [Planctomycetota bacterium]